ncbi:MAG: 1-acyl-sn-glycerol-3-phosphate acyltransferase [Anaerolineales bacterium]|nr:1-acyl-sn-glycerol-3-phosphate acyltransferase [Anaerolineales bacterium]
MDAAPPAYPFPWKTGLRLLQAALLGQQRSFQADARACTSQLSPPPKIRSTENIPTQGPALLVTNHYARPGFLAWWIALAISAALPMEVHWMMTSGWTFLGPLDRPSRVLFTRVARVYGFTPTPPMPARPQEAEARARAVRRVLAYARASKQALVALAPEGRDQPGGILGPFPPGAGRFIQQLSQHCQPIIPIGVYEDEEALCLSFGPAFELQLPPGLNPGERDAQASQQVGQALAQQLPPELRGAYA